MLIETDIGRPMILAVDDMGVNLRTVKLALEKNFDIRLSKSGELALSILSTKKIDLILLDIEMPEMSGFEFIKQMKTIPHLKTIPPVIFVTSFGSSELLAQAKTVGVVDYILKPFEPETLHQKVDKALGITTPEQRQAILAVDDVGINLSTVKIALARDFNVRIAKSGELALSILSTKKIDLILLDIEMPEMSGFEFIEQMKTIPHLKTIPPVIFVTSFGTPELRAKAQVAGVADYILKPFEPETLRKAVDKALGITDTADADRGGIQNQ